MQEPSVILANLTRIRTSERLDGTGGMLISEHHLSQRKPNAIGAICGIVGGHGGDVYFVAHLGATSMAAYGWWEFDLAPAVSPCGECKGSGIDWNTSHAKTLCTPCSSCKGTAESPSGA